MGPDVISAAGLWPGARGMWRSLPEGVRNEDWGGIC